jgi:hypothetical protein
MEAGSTATAWDPLFANHVFMIDAAPTVASFGTTLLMKMQVKTPEIRDSMDSLAS